MVTAVSESSKEHNVYDFETDPQTPQDLKNALKAMLIAICDAVVRSTTADGQNNAKDMKAAEAKDSANAANAKESIPSQAASTSIAPGTKV